MGFSWNDAFGRPVDPGSRGFPWIFYPWESKKGQIVEQKAVLVVSQKKCQIVETTCRD